MAASAARFAFSARAHCFDTCQLVVYEGEVCVVKVIAWPFALVAETLCLETVNCTRVRQTCRNLGLRMLCGSELGERLAELVA